MSAGTADSSPRRGRCSPTRAGLGKEAAFVAGWMAMPTETDSGVPRVALLCQATRATNEAGIRPVVTARDGSLS